MAKVGGHLPFEFSLGERDRRYERVRAMMRRLGFDAIIAPCNTGHNDAFQADVRYLTQVGGFANGHGERTVREVRQVLEDSPRH